MTASPRTSLLIRQTVSVVALVVFRFSYSLKEKYRFPDRKSASGWVRPRARVAPGQLMCASLAFSACPLVASFTMRQNEIGRPGGTSGD